jgi:hypothetical protein
MKAQRACPRCGQHAPIVVRSLDAFCTVCGARRTPFAADILNLAGKPARFGGYAARVLGWGALGVGSFLALTLGLVTQAIGSMLVPGSWLGLAVAIPIALLSVVLWLVGVLGGKKLHRTGEVQLQAAQRDAVHALARHQNGIVRTADAARALGIGEAQADVVLGALAREPAENVSLNLDDEGRLMYLFGSAEAIRWRIRAEQAGITAADREALERELAAATPDRNPDALRARGT